MRILFIDHPQYISGSMMLWQGLNEVLPGKVVLYPHMATHFGVEKVDLLELPWFVEMSKLAAGGKLPWGIPPFSKGEGLCCGDQSTITHFGQVAPPAMPQEIPDEESIVRDLNEGRFDLVILANSNRVPTIALGRLKARVPKMPPIIYYDAGERDELNEHWIHVFKPDLVFKQILTPKVLGRGLSVQIPGYELKMLPLPLSNMFVDHPEFRFGLGDAKCPEVGTLRRNDSLADKTIDMFYYLGETWPTRKPAVQALDSLRIRRGFSYAKGVSFEEYNIILSKTRLAVSMRGSGRDTTRYWEIPMYRTAMVCDGTMGCIHPYPFRDGETAIFYDSIDSLVAVVERSLSESPAKLDSVAMAGKEHLARYHTRAGRAMFFLDRVREHLNVSPSEDQEEKIVSWKDARRWEASWRGPVASANV